MCRQADHCLESYAFRKNQAFLHVKNPINDGEGNSSDGNGNHDDDNDVDDDNGDVVDSDGNDG